MIAVIADDLTGAAEIGGIALRHGLRVVVDTGVPAYADADVLVVATDSRSKEAAEAQKLISDITRRLLVLQPELIFKKTDSLLRGHVAGELVAQMEASGKKRALLVPANPAMQRTVSNGNYYAGGILLHLSPLADAALERFTTSSVIELMEEAYRQEVSVVSLKDPVPGQGLAIGNAGSETDLTAWALRVDNETVPAGSGSFFSAFLASRVETVNHAPQLRLSIGPRLLYVCGSAFPLSKAYVAQARKEGHFVAYMPAAIFCPDADQEAVLRGWAGRIIEGIQQSGLAIIAVDSLLCSSHNLPESIRHITAGVIEKVIQHIRIDELVIEGGATAAAVIKQLGFLRFFPVQELAQGVIRMKVQQAQGLHLTMKPGSYRWPASIWASGMND